VLTKLQSSAALRLVVAALLVTLIAAGALAIGSRKTVTLNVDGTAMTVVTMKSRVADIVEESGFTLGARDSPREFRGIPRTHQPHDCLRINLCLQEQLVHRSPMRAGGRRFSGLDPRERGVDVLYKLRLEWAGHTRTIVANSV
jgi:hypothetical protein